MLEPEDREAFRQLALAVACLTTPDVMARRADGTPLVTWSDSRRDAARVLVADALDRLGMHSGLWM